MDDFGQRLLHLREALHLKNVKIAQRALGEQAVKDQRRDFANYLARIERGEVPSPGLRQLAQIAKGYGVTLSQLFKQLEDPRLFNGIPNAPVEPVSPTPTDGSGASLPAATKDYETLLELGHALITAATAARLANARQQTPGPGAPKPNRAPRARRSRRQTPRRKQG